MGLQGVNHSDTHGYRADYQRRKRVFQTASATRHLQVREVYKPPLHARTYEPVITNDYTEAGSDLGLSLFF
jgi:hypothetical protein